MKNNGIRFVRNAHKVIPTFILIAMLLIGISTNAYAALSIPEATSQFYVNDFADLFTESQEVEMVERAMGLAEQPEGVQVVVTTVKSLNGNDINDYATTMYNKYGIGRDDKGLLILLSTGDRDIWIEVGYGLESTFTDSKVGNYIDKYAMKYLRNNQFADGLMALQSALVSDLIKMYEPKPTLMATKAPEEKNLVAQETKAQPTAIAKEVQTSNDVHRNEESSASDVFSRIILSVFFVFLVCGFVYQTVHVKRIKSILRTERKRNAGDVEKLESRNEHQDNRINELNGIVRSKDKRIKELTDKVSKLSSSLEDMTERRNNLMLRLRHAKQIYPDIDAKVDESIQREIDEHNRLVAENYDAEYGFLCSTEPSIELERAKIREAITSFDELNEKQRELIRTDIEAIRRLLNACNELHDKKEAEEFSSSVAEECSRVAYGTEENLKRFKALNSDFERLRPSVKRFVNMAGMATVNKLISEGESAKRARIEAEEALKRRRAEEEEERRRRSSSSYSSGFSTHHSSSFSHGFGGRSGGGGAGRHF